MKPEEETIIREMNWIEICLNRLKVKLITLRRRFVPSLVWYGSEVDVTINLSEDRINPNNPLVSFKQGRLPEIEKMLREIGISFDTGQGHEGRDWEFDYSLSGPVHVKFRGNAKKPERRQ